MSETMGAYKGESVRVQSRNESAPVIKA